MSKEIDADAELARDIGEFYDDPLGFTLYAFPWGSTPALSLVKLPEKWAKKYECEYGPDEWACSLMDEIGEQVRKNKFDGKNAVDPLRVAVTSGHGIGKSAFTSWIALWIMSTRPFCQGTVTANTAPQLQTKTWAQLAKWKEICITGHWFEITTGKGSMKLYHKEHPSSWFCSGQTCREENSESFAGQHAASSTSFYLFDEASAVPNRIHEVSEGGLTDGEPMCFAFGNPTRNTGWFFESFHKKKHRWITRKVDSRSVQITNKKTHKEWADDYGEDSDFFKVRVKGDFPSLSVNQLIGLDIVEASFKRTLNRHAHHYAPMILGVDVAWEGDDRSAVYARQGLWSKCLGVFMNVDNMTLGGLVNGWWNELEADAVFIDVGWGTGVIDFLRSIGKNPIPVNFGGKALKPDYANKRTEMWCEMESWMADGGMVEDKHDIQDDLTGPEIYFQANGKKLLESKKDMKKRGLRSPDVGDALALTFAAPVQKVTMAMKYSNKPNTVQTDYDVLE